MPVDRTAVLFLIAQMDDPKLSHAGPPHVAEWRGFVLRGIEFVNDTAQSNDPIFAALEHVASPQFIVALAVLVGW